MASEWLEGTIRHRRKLPVQHEFQYNIGMLALDLDEWFSVTGVSPFFSLERFNWLGLSRQDYLDPHEPDLRQAVIKRVQAATGWAPNGPIQLITHPRYLGYVFRSEEHTSELQSRPHLVCRLLLEKKKNKSY